MTTLLSSCAYACAYLFAVDAVESKGASHPQPHVLSGKSPVPCRSATRNAKKGLGVTPDCGVDVLSAVGT